MERTIDEAGWLAGVRRLASPNADERPEGVPVDLLIIHCISLPPGEFGGCWIDDLFCNRLDFDAHPYFHGLRGLRVSSHLLVRRDGRVTQYVPLHRRAWHAGASAWEGRGRCNDYSIGIELEGTETLGYSDAQYLALARLTREIRRAFPAITDKRIVGHSDVAPGRKTDPGPAFDWARLRSELAAAG